MLQKKHQPFCSKLRIIQLFEADLNAALKILLGRRLMHTSEKFEINTNETHGSLPGRTTHDALLTARLAADNARLLKHSMLTIFNDAAGCYDRIRPNLNTLLT